jgi:hypothetical protein
MMRDGDRDILEVTHRWWRPGRTSYRSSFVLVGCLASSASVISLIQRWLDVGIVPLLFEMLSYYRKIAHLLLTPVLTLIPFKVPVWYQDAYVLSLVFVMAFMKAVTLETDQQILYDDLVYTALNGQPRLMAKTEKLQRFFDRALIYLIGIVLNFFLIGLIWPFIMIEKLVRGWRQGAVVVGELGQPGGLFHGVQTLLVLAITFLSASVYFILNSLL